MTIFFQKGASAGSICLLKQNFPITLLLCNAIINFKSKERDPMLKFHELTTERWPVASSQFTISHCHRNSEI